MTSKYDLVRIQKHEKTKNFLADIGKRILEGETRETIAQDIDNFLAERTTEEK